MIRRALTDGDLDGLPKYGLEAQKIRALLVSYGLKYDFCRFYVGEWETGKAFLGGLNGSFVLSENEECDFGELAEFLGYIGVSELFCSESAGERLPYRVEKVNVMRFEGIGESYPVLGNPPLAKPQLAEPPLVEPSLVEPSLVEVYEVLKTAFDIEFEPWYLDMSHRIRHGVSSFRMLDGSVLAIQHNLNGEALLSQVATVPEMRRRGNAGRLIRSVCAELSGSAVYVVCSDELRIFYEKLGFRRDGACCLAVK